MHVSRAEFERLVEEGLSEIPPRFLAELKNVAIVVKTEPTPTERRAAGVRAGTLLLGLYEGVPHTEGGHTHRFYPDRITLFQRHIEAVAASGSDIARVVAETVRHEIAHHLGMGETEVRRAERRGTMDERPRRQ